MNIRREPKLSSQTTSHTYNLGLDTMNQIRCLNLDGDEVHVIERVPDGSVESVLNDLQHDLYASITVITQDGNEIVWK